MPKFSSASPTALSSGRPMSTLRLPLHSRLLLSLLLRHSPTRTMWTRIISMLSATVTNTGGPFSPAKFTAGFYDADGNLLTRIVAPNILIDQNETTTIYFHRRTSFNGVQGDHLYCPTCTIMAITVPKFLSLLRLTLSNFTINATPTSIGSVGTSANSIFPNPAADAVTVRNANAISGISVYSVTGALVLSKAISGQNSVNLNVASLPAGSYIVRVATAAGITTQRFIKK
jgi:hypothetical protein